MWRCKASSAIPTYQISLGQRYSGLQYYPDDIGDLMFNGVAGQINQSDRASTLQADFSMPWGGSHTLRYGLYGEYDHAFTNTSSLVFPANPDGSQASTTPFGIFTGSNVTAKTWAAYVQDEWNISDNWTINYGLRGDQYEAAREESQLSPRVGVVWQATREHHRACRLFALLHAAANGADFQREHRDLCQHHQRREELR